MNQSYNKKNSKHNIQNSIYPRVGKRGLVVQFRRKTEAEFCFFKLGEWYIVCFIILYALYIPY